MIVRSSSKVGYYDAEYKYKYGMMQQDNQKISSHNRGCVAPVPHIFHPALDNIHVIVLDLPVHPIDLVLFPNGPQGAVQVVLLCEIPQYCLLNQ